jgi:hypothetical protein
MTVPLSVLMRQRRESGGDVNRNASESPSEGASRLDRAQVYLDALAIEEEAPGTVCILERHYLTGRHPIPYRQGYCHYYREPGEHYHRTLAELERCEQ